MTNGVRSAQIIDLNLLPPSLRPLEISGRALVIAATFAITIIALVPLAWYAGSARNAAAAADHRAGDAEVILQTLQVDLTRARALRVEIDDTRRLEAERDAERAALQQGERPLQDDLAMLFGGFLPAGARVTKVTASDGAFRVDGVAANPLDAIAYADRLVEAGGFAGARMASYTPGTTGGTFAVDVTR